MLIWSDRSLSPAHIEKKLMVNSVWRVPEQITIPPSRNSEGLKRIERLEKIERLVSVKKIERLVSVEKAMKI